MLIFSFISSILFMIVLVSFVVMLIFTYKKQKKEIENFNEELDDTLKRITSYDIRS